MRLAFEEFVYELILERSEGKKRRVSRGKGLIVSGSFFSELPTKRFGETPKRGRLPPFLASFFPFPFCSSPITNEAGGDAKN